MEEERPTEESGEGVLKKDEGEERGRGERKEEGNTMKRGQREESEEEETRG